MTSENLIEISGLNFSYDTRAILKGIDMTMQRGKVIAIMGGSGSGKTTLLRLIGGTIQPTSGYVKFAGKVVHELDRDALFKLRRKMGMLFQFGALFTDLPVFDNVAFQMREHTNLPESMIRDLVLLKLAMVELEPRHGSLMPAELSGGMVKRVALARALSLEPELLVLDEPTAGLDPDLAENFVQLIKLLQQELGFTVVMVTHDLDTLAGLATRLAVLADQKIIACGTVAEVLAVDHPFIHTFFGSGRAAAAIRQEAI